MLVLAALIGLAQPHEATPPLEAPAAAYVILADELRRKRVERLVSELAAEGTEYAAHEEGGLYYVSCVTAWRGNPLQTEDCIRSRLPNRRQAPLVVLNTYHREARKDVTAVSCVGRGSSGRALLRQRASSGDAPALRRCVQAALHNSEAPSRGWFGTRHTDEFEFQDAAEARAGAAKVVRIAVDHVGVPRGSTGSCLVQGRVEDVSRAAERAPRQRIQLGVPCGSLLSRGPRRLHMGALREGAFANVYLSHNRSLLDYEPLP